MTLARIGNLKEELNGRDDGRGRRRIRQVTRMFVGSNPSVSFRRQCGPEATRMAAAPPGSLQIVDRASPSCHGERPPWTPAARLRARDAVGTLRARGECHVAARFPTSPRRRASRRRDSAASRFPQRPHRALYPMRWTRLPRRSILRRLRLQSHRMRDVRERGHARRLGV
jgi:hypothetical protein